MTADRIHIGDDRIEANVNWPEPKNIKELRSALGMVNIIRKYVPDLARILTTLVALTKSEAAKVMCRARVRGSLFEL